MANISDDTICAISTPAGVGGIAVIRISGSDAIAIADRLWHGKPLDTTPSHTARFGTIEDPDTHHTLDEAVATVFRAPASFTGENVVELSVHGSIWIQNRLIQLLIHAGCRLAQPGEFTRRAFASGKLDLAEAEAIADVIASTSRASHRVAMSQMRGQFSRRLSDLRDKLLELASLLELELDFSEEHVEFADRAKLLDLSEQTRNEVSRLAESFATGDAIRRGIPVAIIGKPNVGKSSILNRLLNDNRAIVSDIPGTTRDTIEDTADINGYTFRFIDTAGLRQTADTVENLGIERARQKASQARIILWVIDPDSISGNQHPLYNTSSQILDEAREIAAIKHPDASLILVLNKSDLITDQNAAISAIRQTISGTSCSKSDITPSEPVSHQSSPAQELHPGETHAENKTSTLHISSSVAVSALTDCGFDNLRQALSAHISQVADTSDSIIITNARHYEALSAAAESLSRVTAGLSTELSADFIAQDVRETIHHLSSITGAITTPDILSTIFSRFCIGK